MDFLTTTLGLLFTITLIYSLQLLSTRGKKLPPGPTPLPIIGNLLLLGDQPHKSLAELAKIYGPLMSLRLGQRSTVVISSSAMAKEVLQKQDLAFSSRNIQDSFHAKNHFKYSVVLLPVASRWRSLRKIMNLNIFSGTRLDAKQELRCRKVQELVDYCRESSQSGVAVDVGRAAFMTTLNLLSNTIFSRDLTDRFSDSAKEFKDMVRDIMTEHGKPNLADYFPLLNKVDPQGIRRRTTVHLGKLIELFSGLISERLEKRNSTDDEDNDVLDALLRASQESPEEIDRTHIEHLFLVST
ncbi:hypothetical protein BUALT_Bualt04G0118300 [Buddleja alternifolia]|uniref:Cytochrome P450 76AD1-like protein n=1 Tax=Buddleja alternifolia TaxID=168488 RepID=A0AAV6XWA5_9LAMI|nr:hypothetical protein BUALT_Bualt04G0118300 [Buddleja alternifolia]